MTKRNIHVVPHEGGWAAEKEGAKRASFVGETKAEVESQARAQAKAVLDHVLHCGYEDARVSNAAFSCLFLNPPYDWQAGESGEPDREAVPSNQ